jgi:hypothetical protein
MYEGLYRIIENNFYTSRNITNKISLIILGMLEVRSVNLTKIAPLMEESCSTRTNYRQLQKFFQKFSFSEKQLANLILKVE